MKLNHVLITFKHGMADGFPKADVITAKHLDTLLKVKQALDFRGIKYTEIERDKLSRELIDTEKPDILIPVGGDGTVLAAAHVAGATPILAVNSAPGYSVGFFCSAAEDNFDKMLDDVVNDKLKPLVLPLLEATIDGKAISTLALNEILFAADSPAETARYEISIGKKTERQRSSGVWIAAGPGSTAAIMSAGGKKQEITSNKIQVVVREACPMAGTNYELTNLLLDESETVTIKSEMKDGVVCLDGPHFTHRCNMGATLQVSIAKRTLEIFI